MLCNYYRTQLVWRLSLYGQRSLAKPEVQAVLKENLFLKVNDNEYGKVPTGSGSFGIPMYFVLDNTGKSLGKWRR